MGSYQRGRDYDERDSSRYRDEPSRDVQGRFANSPEITGAPEFHTHFRQRELGLDAVHISYGIDHDISAN